MLLICYIYICFISFDGSLGEHSFVWSNVLSISVDVAFVSHYYRNPLYKR